MNNTFVVDTAARKLLGVSLLVLAAVLVLLGLPLDWGVSVVLVFPAVVLLFPAGALLRRVRITVNEGSVVREAGSSTAEIGLQDTKLEVLPTAGAFAVILHGEQGEQPLATWLTRKRADELVALLEAAHGEPLPRHDRAAAHWDI